MKVLNQTPPWPNKINFVDDNNVILGYDLVRQCCEVPSWYISQDKPSSVDDLHDNGYCDIDAPDYNFDPNFFEAPEGGEGSNDRWTRFVIFRLVHKDGDGEAFLVLVNNHSGYYSHGFQMDVGGIPVVESCL